MAFMKPVFVSYSQQDEGQARELEQILVEHGFAPTLAGDATEHGGDALTDFAEGMREADAVVLLIGSDPSIGARREWTEALRASWDEDRELSLVPVVLPQAETPSFLADREVVRISEDSEGWDEVAHVLENPAGAAAVAASTTGELDDRLHELQKTVATMSDYPESA
jgi:TIR domain